MFSSSFGRVVFLRTGFTCAHLKSSRNKPEQSDVFIIYVIGLIKTSRHVFSSMVGSGSRSQDLVGDNMIIFSLQRLWLVKTMRIRNLVVERQHLQCLGCDL